MRLRTSILAFFAFACVSEPQTGEWQAQPRPIIGGQASTASDFPTTGVLLAKAEVFGMEIGQMVCTGTLIAPDVVLTAAHCTSNPFEQFATFDYYFSFELDVSGFGQTTQQLPADAILVAERVTHPDFDFQDVGGMGGMPPSGLGNFKDIALIFLANPVSWMEPAVIAEPDDAPLVTAGTDVDIAGYGQLQQGAMTAGVKYHARTIINETNASEMQIGDLPPTPQKCHGDSGGPTYLEVDDGKMPRRRVIGVTSRAYDQSDCMKGGVDIRVDFFRDWLVTEMTAGCTDGRRSFCVGDGAPRLPGDPAPMVPPDAGVVVTPDSGVVATVDAGVPADVGVSMPQPDATVVADSGTTPPTNMFSARRNEPKDSCGCSATPTPRDGGFAALMVFGLLALRRRS